MAEQVNNQGLYQALGLFTQGVKDYALSTALSDANEQVQQIKLAGIDGAKQRQALGGVAQSLVSQMLGAGASASSVEAASQNILPKLPATADGAVLQGIYTGNQDLVAAGQGAQDSAARRQNEQLGQQEAIRLRMQSQLFQQQDSLQTKREAMQEKMAQLKEQNRKPTTEEFKVAGFAKRLSDAEQVFSQLGEKGFDPTSFSNQVASGLASVPLLGGNRVRSESLQQFDQAKRSFVNAVLRRESGAAIADSEFKSADLQYFPQPGDSPATLAQKAQTRAAVIQNFAAEGGPAFAKMGIELPTIKALTPNSLNTAPTSTTIDLKQFIRPSN